MRLLNSNNLPPLRFSENSRHTVSCLRMAKPGEWWFNLHYRACRCFSWVFVERCFIIRHYFISEKQNHIYQETNDKLTQTYFSWLSLCELSSVIMLSVWHRGQAAESQALSRRGGERSGEKESLRPAQTEDQPQRPTGLLDVVKSSKKKLVWTLSGEVIMAKSKIIC